MNNCFKDLLIVSAAVVFLLMSCQSVGACSCGPPPTVDIVAAKTPTIAIFKVESVKKYAEGEGEGIQAAKLVVERVFKGNVVPGTEYVFSNDGICLLRFEQESVGEKYLLYLNEKPARGESLFAGMCNRSGPVRATADDVLYLEKRGQVRGKTRLSGQISQETELDSSPRNYYFKKLPGLPIRIRGNGKDIGLKTDQNGAYEIYGLPPGKYQIILPAISGFTTNVFADSNEPISTEIFPGKHTEENAFYSIDNSVKGRLVDREGKPIGGVCLDLIPTSHILPDYLRKDACTNVEGEFGFTDILSGTYILVGNSENKISPREPFTTFYYPDKPDVAEAVKFTLAPGTHFTELIMKAPEFSGVISVNGVMRFSDGKPVSKGHVEFFADVSEKSQINDPLSYASTAETDENGNFRLRIMSGQKGLLIGFFRPGRDEYNRCAQIRENLDTKNYQFEIETPVVKIDSNGSRDGLELKYPFPSCSKKN